MIPCLSNLINTSIACGVFENLSTQARHGTSSEATHTSVASLKFFRKKKKKEEQLFWGLLKYFVKYDTGTNMQAVTAVAKIMPLWGWKKWRLRRILFTISPSKYNNQSCPK